MTTVFPGPAIANRPVRVLAHREVKGLPRTPIDQESACMLSCHINVRIWWTQCRNDTLNCCDSTQFVSNGVLILGRRTCKQLTATGLWKASTAVETVRQDQVLIASFALQVELVQWLVVNDWYGGIFRVALECSAHTRERQCLHWKRPIRCRMAGVQNAGSWFIIVLRPIRSQLYVRDTEAFTSARQVCMTPRSRTRRGFRLNQHP